MPNSHSAVKSSNRMPQEREGVGRRRGEWEGGGVSGRGKGRGEWERIGKGKSKGSAVGKGRRSDTSRECRDQLRLVEFL